MTRKNPDYVYRNGEDSLRVRVFRRENDRWDYDVFYPSGKIVTYSEAAGDDFRTKRDALERANEENGFLSPVVTEGSVVDKAWYATNMARRSS